MNNVDSKELARLESYKSTLNFDDTMPKIGYVGKEQLVVYDNMGVYVYDLSSSDLTDYVDFEKIILRDYREMMQHLFMYRRMDGISS